MRDFEDYGWRDVLTDDMARIFSAYHRPRNVSKRSALVVVHPAAGFRATIQPDWAQATSRLCDAVADHGYPNILSVPPGTALLPELKAKKYLRTCQRPCESAFFFSDLAAVLTQAGVEAVIVCGAPTSGAVRATAVEAKSYGFRAAIAEETTGDEAALLHKMALFDIAHKYADVMTIEELLSALQDKADG
jgi:nicotinamidase-related amidase